jgi:hypothetical protein
MLTLTESVEANGAILHITAGKIHRWSNAD